MKKMFDGRIKKKPFSNDPKRQAVYFYWLDNTRRVGLGNDADWLATMKQVDNSIVDVWFSIMENHIKHGDL